MPFRGPSPAELDRVVEQVLPLLMDDPNNPLSSPVGLSFAQIEQMSSRIAQRLAARLTERTLDRHSEATQAATPEVACPKCLILNRLTRKKRRVTTAAGEIEYHEPASHCVDCRRDFFSGP
jgi:hypothetical protein